MSADLLRRAATTLRKHAKVATDGTWAYEADDEGESIGAGFTESPEDGQMVYLHHPDDFGTCLGDNDGRYVALMHPPVAAALADWLDGYATLWDRWPKTLETTGDDPSAAAVTLARAILREAADA